MRRRQFMTLVGCTAAWPLAAHAQQKEVPRIGVLMGMAKDDPETQVRVSQFENRLQELGWSDNHNIRIEYRWIGDSSERLRADADEIVSSLPTLIVADTTAALTALRAASRTVPIVFLRVSDPVNAGFVDNLARPGGNTTGIANFEYSMGGKWLELLKQVDPRISHITTLSHPEMTVHQGLLRAIEAAAPSFSVTTKIIQARNSADIESAIIGAASEPDSGLILLPHLIIELNRSKIIEMTARHRVPTMYPLRHYASAGGLIAYGPEPTEFYRQTATLVDRILRGARVGDIPIQQATKFDLSVNLRTARALGLTVSARLLALADEVIE